MSNAQALSIAVVAFANVGRDAVSTLRGELAALKDDKGRYPYNLGSRPRYDAPKPWDQALEKAAKAIFNAEAVYSEAVLRAITSHGGTPEEVVTARHAGNAVLIMAAKAVFGLSDGIYLNGGRGKQLLDLGRDAERTTRDVDERSSMAPRMAPRLTVPMVSSSMSPMSGRSSPMG